MRGTGAYEFGKIVKVCEPFSPIYPEDLEVGEGVDENGAMFFVNVLAVETDPE